MSITVAWGLYCEALALGESRHISEFRLGAVQAGRSSCKQCPIEYTECTVAWPRHILPAVSYTCHSLEAPVSPVAVDKSESW